MSNLKLVIKLAKKDNKICNIFTNSEIALFSFLLLLFTFDWAGLMFNCVFVCYLFAVSSE